MKFKIETYTIKFIFFRIFYRSLQGLFMDKIYYLLDNIAYTARINIIAIVYIRLSEGRIVIAYETTT